MARLALVCALLLAVIGGCAKQPGIDQVASAPAPAAAEMTPARPDAGRAAGGTSSVAAPRTPAAAPARSTTTIRGGAERPAPGDYVDTAELHDIHFDFDSYELRDIDQSTLDNYATWLKERTATLLLIEGHCDRRGTVEYNMSLGERRAKATANYLVSRGVASHRITIISYGEERPVCRDNNERCWSRNRRAHFLVKDQ